MMPPNFRVSPVSMSLQTYRDQFGFQREHSKGRVLNVGSNTDGGCLAADFGAVNIDLRARDHVTGMLMPVAALADARALPFAGVFDTVILGEILEHMERPDAVRSLREAAAAIGSGGRVVITMPHDGRRESGKLETPKGEQQFYAPGIYAYHYRSISRLELLGWIREAGLEAEVIARIAYVWGEQGSGIVARRAEA
jgi:SAM-dependent methyltransferase